MKRVLSLCDRSGVMVQPWLDAGYPCTIVDLQHPEGETTDGLLTRVGGDVASYLPSLDEYEIVFAFPPCTHLAVSGARWWRDKGLQALIEGLTLVEACRRIADWTGAPYMIENPVGAISSHWRKPDHAFDPLDFGAYVLDGEDFTKRTHLWTGGGFVMPAKRPLPMSTENNPIHWAPNNKDRADTRSVTPRGFAQAVFEANHCRRMPWEPLVTAGSGPEYRAPASDDYAATSGPCPRCGSSGHLVHTDHLGQRHCDPCNLRWDPAAFTSEEVG